MKAITKRATRRFRVPLPRTTPMNVCNAMTWGSFVSMTVTRRRTVELTSVVIATLVSPICCIKPTSLLEIGHFADYNGFAHLVQCSMDRSPQNLGLPIWHPAPRPMLEAYQTQKERAIYVEIIQQVSQFSKKITNHVGIEWTVDQLPLMRREVSSMSYYIALY